jgi:curved DNA-binding protein CbpA
MKMDNYDFVETIILDLKVRHAASQILEVRESVSRTELEKAYQRASLRYHPDHNQGDLDANKKFILVKFAYELLAEDKPFPALLEEINDWPGVPDDDKYELDNQWGHFLWWRDKFFDSEKGKRSSDKRSSCV